MRKVAIVYITRMGHTAKVVAHLKHELEKRECIVQSFNLNVCKPEIETDVEMVIYGAPVYAGHFSRRLKKWVSKNHAALRTKTRAFFSVSLNHADKHEEARETDAQLLRDFFASTGLVPDYAASFGGCLAYTRYPFFIRGKMRQISARAGGSVDMTRDHDYTDWNEVTNFASDLALERPDSKFAVSQSFANDLDRLIPEYEFTCSKSLVIEGFKTDEIFRLAEAAYDLRSSCIQLNRTPSASITYARLGHVTPTSFKPFVILEPSSLLSAKVTGVTKEFVGLRFKPLPDNRVRVSVEFRAHSTDSRTRAIAKIYYRLAGPWIRLEIRRFLSRVRKLGAETVLSDAETAAAN